MSQSDIPIDRLEDQINWYDKKARSNERMFKRLKLGTLTFSVLIPLSAVAATHFSTITAIVTATLGATIALLEGLQQLGQYHQNWITYRSTAEALKHEKFLFLGAAGPYANANNSKSLLAERVESLVSQEHSKWTSVQELPAKGKAPATTP
jgi:hypothetical protein